MFLLYFVSLCLCGKKIARKDAKTQRFKIPSFFVADNKDVLIFLYKLFGLHKYNDYIVICKLIV